MAQAVAQGERTVGEWRSRLPWEASSLRPLEVMPGVFQLTPWAANVFLIVEEELTLLDCGPRGSAPLILSFIRRLGRSPREVRQILITHHHYDHAGEVVRLRQATGARVSVHAADIALPGQGLPYPIPHPASRLLHYPPLSALRRLLVVEARYFDARFYGGEVLSPLGGIEVVHTPGHTPGSVCFFFRRRGLLIVGDALNHRRQLALPRRMACVNPGQARRSLERLLDLPFEVLCFGHGRPLGPGARRHLEALLSPP